MGKHKKVVCVKCCRVMRSNNLERHMQQHENGKFEGESFHGSSFSASLLKPLEWKGTSGKKEQSIEDS